MLRLIRFSELVRCRSISLSKYQRNNDENKFYKDLGKGNVLQLQLFALRHIVVIFSVSWNHLPLNFSDLWTSRPPQNFGSKSCFWTKRFQSCGVFLFELLYLCYFWSNIGCFTANELFPQRVTISYFVSFIQVEHIVNYMLYSVEISHKKNRLMHFEYKYHKSERLIGVWGWRNDVFWRASTVLSTSADSKNVNEFQLLDNVRQIFKVT